MKRIVIIGAVGLVACGLSFIAGRVTVEPDTYTIVKQVAAPDPDARIVKNPDGTRDVYVRSSDARTIERNRLGAREAHDFARVIYRLDEKGSVMSSKIFSPVGEEMFKVSYGYQKNSGRLVEERMFDSRNKRLDEQGKEQPVQRFIHLEDGQTVPISLKGDAPQPVLFPFHNPFMN